MKQKIYLTLLVGLPILFFCAKKENASPQAVMALNPAAFDAVIDGKKVSLYFLRNQSGLQMAVTNFGARVVALMTPDRSGRYEDIVLGFDSLQGYFTSTESFFGAAVGRYGNRIAKGRFTLAGKTYQLTQNNNGQSLHGGPKGFHNVVWDAQPIGRDTLVLTYTSPDGEEGFPGTLSVEMKYILSDENAFRIEYRATTDQPTVINLTHHSFFNLHGAGNGTINDHELWIDADRYTPVDSVLIPTGELALVEGTAMDFRTATPIGLRLDADFDQFKMGHGYDHNYVLNKPVGEKVPLAAAVYDRLSGRYMEVYTSEPGMQFYGGNFLNGKAIGKKNKPYAFRSAFCLETQHFPDSPNQPNFPSVVLNPGETYQHVCIYKFSVK